MRDPRKTTNTSGSTFCALQSLHRCAIHEKQQIHREAPFAHYNRFTDARSTKNNKYIGKHLLRTTIASPMRDPRKTTNTSGSTFCALQSLPRCAIHEKQQIHREA